MTYFAGPVGGEHLLLYLAAGLGLTIILALAGVVAIGNKHTQITRQIRMKRLAVLFVGVTALLLLAVIYLLMVKNSIYN